jgi:hypothetical protein
MRSNSGLSVCGAVFDSKLSRGALAFAEFHLAVAAPVLAQTLQVEEITCFDRLDWIEISQSGERHAERSLIEHGDASVTTAKREEWKQGIAFCAAIACFLHW